MAGSELKITGLEELKAALRNLPKELVGEADGIVRRTASMMAQDVLARYPTTGTGALARGVTVEVGSSDALTARAVVRNRARHAYIFENATKSPPRRWKKGSTTAPYHKKGTRTVPLWGIGKSTGTMPGAGVFRTLAPEHRRRMFSQLIDLVERAGLKVTGSPT